MLGGGVLVRVIEKSSCKVAFEGLVGGDITRSDLEAWPSLHGCEIQGMSRNESFSCGGDVIADVSLDDPPDDRILFKCSDGVLHKVFHVEDLVSFSSVVVDVALIAVASDDLSPLFQLRQMEKLVLDRCENIGFLPHGFEGCQKLRSLKIHGCYIGNIPDDVCTLTNLKTLDVRYAEIESLPQHLGSLRNVRKLCFSYGRLKSIPESIGQMTQLQCLMLDGNSLTELPDDVAYLSHLRSLHCGSNRIRNVSSIAQCICNNVSELKVLDLNFNRLDASSVGLLCEAIASSGACLTHLMLGFNQVGDEGCQYIGQMLHDGCKITHLDLSSNRISSVGVSHMNVGNLKCLKLSRNAIKDEGALAIADHCDMLEELEMIECQMGAAGLKAMCEKAKCLKVLNVEENQLGMDALDAVKRLIANGVQVRK